MIYGKGIYAAYSDAAWPEPTLAHACEYCGRAFLHAQNQCDGCGASRRLARADTPTWHEDAIEITCFGDDHRRFLAPNGRMFER